MQQNIVSSRQWGNHTLPVLPELAYSLADVVCTCDKVCLSQHRVVKIELNFKYHEAIEGLGVEN